MASAQQQVTLTGCVQTGQLETEYVLRNVRTAGGQPSRQTEQQQAQPSQPPDQAQPSQQARRTEEQEAKEGEQPTEDIGITPYSFVQLRAQNPADLRQYVGQEVRVTGTMTDTGGSTIGTSGTSGTHQTPSGDTSAAAATELSHPEKKKAEAGPIARDSMSNSTAPIVRVENITPTGNKCVDMPQAIDPPKQK